jgi:hypothetical protein
MRLRACPANVLRVLRCDPFDRALGPLCVGAGPIADGFQFSNALLQHRVGEIGDAVLDGVVEPLELASVSATRLRNSAICVAQQENRTCGLGESFMRERRSARINIAPERFVEWFSLSRLSFDPDDRRVHATKGLNAHFVDSGLLHPTYYFRIRVFKSARRFD